MMKKLLIITLLAAMFSFGANAQVTLNFNPLVSSAVVGDTVTVTVEGVGMDDIAGFQAGLKWDSTIIKTVDANMPVQNVHSNFTGFGANQSSADTLALVSIEIPAVNVTGNLFEISFIVQAIGSTDLYFAGTEILDGNFSAYTVTTQTATITGTSGTVANPLQLDVASVSAIEGTTACAEVTVTADFVDITQLDFSLEWNNTIAGFNNTMALNSSLAGATFNTSQTGKLGFEFNSATGVDLSAGAVLFSACYVADGSAGSSTPIIFGDNPVVTVVENSTGTIGYTFTNGSFASNNATPPDTIFLHFNPAVSSAEVGSTVNIALEIEGTKPVAAVQLGFEWDQAIIHTLDSSDPVTNVNPLFNTGAGGGYIANQEIVGQIEEDTLSFAWVDGTEHNLSGVLFEIPYVVQAEGMTDIFITGTEFLRANLDEYVVVFDTAKITGLPTTNGVPAKLAVEMVSTDMGTTTCAQVSVLSDFTDITKLDFSLDWDNSIASFSNTMALNTALSSATFNTSQTGKLGFEFNTTTGVTLAPNDVLFSVCYMAVGAASSSTPIAFGDSPVTTIVENSNGDIGGLFTNGSFSINSDGSDLILTIPDVTGMTGTNVCVPMTVENFTDITAVSFSLAWDTSILTYTGATIANVPGGSNPLGSLNENSVANGALGYIYFSFSNIPITYPAGTTLLDVCFDVIGNIGDVSPITFTNTPIDYSSANSDGNVVLTTHNGSLTIASSNPPIVINPMVNNLSCNATNDGSIQLAPTGGDGTYTYAWTGPGGPHSGASLTGLGAGIYTVMVSSNGETATGTYTLTESGFTLSLVSLINEANPPGGNGSIEITPSGTGNYAYVWTGPGSPFSDASSINNLAAGNYSVVVTDDDACTASMALEIKTLTATGAFTNPICNGETNGTITIDVLGGTMPYTYQWNPNNLTGSSPSGLGAGSYSVTVSDGTGAQIVLPFSLVDPAAINIQLDGIVNEDSGMNNGAVNITATGGTGALTYLWTGGTTEEDLIGAAAGVYSVTATDASGCSATAGPFNIIVTGAPEATYSVDDVNCNGESSGSITISAISGGAAPYTVTGIGASQTNLPIVYNNLAAGSYTIMITDANSVETTVDILVQEPQLLQVTGVAITPSSGSDGAISYTVSGGTPGYTFDWSDDTYDGQEDISGLAAGNYTVVITDDNGCATTEFFEVMNASLPVGAFQVADANCNGDASGSITVSSITGGVAPYTVTGIGAPQSDLPITYTMLVAGSYNLTITDDNGLTSTLSPQVGQPEALVISNINITATASNNGVIMYDVSGGAPDYTYDWDHDAYDGIQDIFGLVAEDYSVTVTDANGCTVIQTFTVPSVDPLVAVVSSQGASCYGGSGGSIMVSSISGGAPTYSISIPGQGTKTTDGTQPVVFDALIAGDYTLTITDDAGSTVTYVETVTQPTQILINVVGVNSEVFPTGNNGAIEVDVSGGTGSYSYSWSPTNQTTQNISGLTAGTYTLTVQDVNGCQVTSIPIVVGQESESFTCSTEATDTDCPESTNGSITLTVMGGSFPLTTTWKKNNAVDTFATTFHLMDAGVGTYTVTVKDATGAISTCTAVIGQQSFLTGSISVLSSYNGYGVSGFGVEDGSAQATPSMGVAPYSYFWSSNETDDTAVSLAGGDISVTITDDIGCMKVLSENLTEPDVMSCTATGTDTPCPGSFDGAVSLTENGGVTAMNYSYAWTGPNSFNATSKNIQNLGAGTYLVTVTDANGNSTSCNAVVGVISNMDLIIEHISNYNGFDLPTPDANVGEAKADVTGGQAPYTFLWSNGSTEQQPDTLSAGSISVTVTDNLGCTSIASTVLTAPGAFFCNVETTNSTCPDVPEGTATVVLSGGVMPIASYFWTGPNNPPTDSMIIHLSQGTYDITVTDANGVSTTCSGMVGQESFLEASVQIGPYASSATSTDGQATAIPAGGVEPYTFLWSTGETTAVATTIPGGAATVTVTDDIGCTTTISFMMPVEGELVASFDVVDVTCIGVCNGMASIAVAGGNTPYSYAWDGGQTDKSVDELCAGEYTVTVTDLDGLTAQFTALISEPDSLKIDFDVTHPSGPGNNDGSVVVTVTGGTPNYAYNWNEGTMTANLTNKGAGTYILIVADANNCTRMESVLLKNGIADDCFIAPLVLTPDLLDGSNDVFDITCLSSVTENELSIFSRFGQLVYQTKEYTGDWKGVDNSKKLLPEGAYFWVLKYKINGESFEKKGHVTIVK